MKIFPSLKSFSSPADSLVTEHNLHSFLLPLFLLVFSEEERERKKEEEKEMKKLKRGSEKDVKR